MNAIAGDRSLRCIEFTLFVLADHFWLSPVTTDCQSLLQLKASLALHMRDYRMWVQQTSMRWAAVYNIRAISELGQVGPNKSLMSISLNGASAVD